MIQRFNNVGSKRADLEILLTDKGGMHVVDSGVVCVTQKVCVCVLLESESLSPPAGDRVTQLPARFTFYVLYA